MAKAQPVEQSEEPEVLTEVVEAEGTGEPMEGIEVPVGEEGELVVAESDVSEGPIAHQFTVVNPGPPAEEFDSDGSTSDQAEPEA
jgi:hypothetical protein